MTITYWLPGDHRIAIALWSGSPSTAIGVPVAASHMRTPPGLDPVAMKRPSGDHAIEDTPVLVLLRMRWSCKKDCFCTDTIHTLAVPSSLAVAKRRASLGQVATSKTTPA